jgi:ABC-2 type transport system permease protein
MLRRTLALVAAHARISVALLAQYRLELVGALVMSFFWTSTAIVPLVVLFGVRQSVAGWSWAEALLVVGWFNLLKGIQGSVIQPSMQDTIAHIRRGTLDFVLIKPVDAQLLVSTSRFNLKELADCVAGLAILSYSLFELGHLPTLTELALALLLLGCAVAILYSIWVLVMSLAFVLVRVDNLTYLFSSLFDAARWPATVYRGVWAILFTFVLPLAVMTTFPALGLLGRIAGHQVAGALAAATFFLMTSRWLWLRAVRSYTSAGG